MKNLTNLDTEILRVLSTQKYGNYTGFLVYRTIASHFPDLQNPKGKRKVHKRIAMLMQHGMILNLSQKKDRYELQITQFGKEQLAIVDPPTLENFFNKDLLEK
jgi:hypothetical protein